LDSGFVVFVLIFTLILDLGFGRPFILSLILILTLFPIFFSSIYQGRLCHYISYNVSGFCLHERKEEAFAKTLLSYVMFSICRIIQSTFIDLW